MNFLKTLILVGSLPFLVVACADESPWGTSGSNGLGKINLHVNTSSDVSSEMPNVRSVSTDIVTPDVSLFQVRMTNLAGDYVKSWSSVEDFEKETEFRADTYTIEAFYGSPDSQGILKSTDNGYEYSYYYGISDPVKVEPGKEASVHIQTALANAVVVIEYSDAFKNYFSDWETQLITQGQSPLNLENNEGMCYVIPGNVDVVINATQQNGKSVKVNPAVFVAEAQHLYKITYNIYNGEIGHTETLQVIFNDQPDAEHTIEIDLNDELLTGDGPVITTDGFESEEQIETLSGSPYDGVIKFHIDSPSGFSQAILTIKSDTYKADFLTNNTIDLCSADVATQSQLDAAGIKVIGLFNNPERLALVDMTDFCRYLPEGEHTISLMVKDRARVADASVKLITYPISLKAQPAAPSIFGRKYADILLSYNGSDPTVAGSNPFSFKVKGDGDFEEVEIRNISKTPVSRAFDSVDYVYRISVPDADTEEFPVEIYFNNGSTPVAKTEVTVDYPSYRVAYDPMATKVMMRIESVDDPDIDFSKDEIKAMFQRRLRVFIDGLENKSLTKKEDTRVTVASSLPAQEETFNIKTTLALDESKYAFSDEQTFKYEEKLQVPNGNFTDVANTYTSGTINVGGQYSISLSIISRDYQNFSSISIEEAKGWGSLNGLTCYPNSNPLNTWYMVPGTFVADNVCTVRTVGYNHSGKAIPKSSNGLTTTYYCKNVPEKSDLNIKAGELFLGSYSYTGSSESRENGVSFRSRPGTLTFKYSYMPISGETASVALALKDENGYVISSAEGIITGTAGSWSFDESTLGAPSETFTMDLPDYPFNRKAATIELLFKSSSSSSPDIYIPSGDDLKQPTITETNFTTDRGRTIPTNEYKSYSKGSVLKVSDISLIY